MSNILRWIDDHFYSLAMAALIAVGVIMVVGLVVIFSAPINDDVPMPLDVCQGTQSNVVRQDNIATIDYVNLRGDTVYLVYGLSSGAPNLRSKQVIDGDDCKQ